MASFDEVKLEDILHCSFATFNPDTGANKDADSLPTAVVYEEGSSTALTSTVTVTNMTTGRYRLSVTIAAADGYEAGKYYELWASATVTGTGSPVTQSAPLISFKATTSVVDDLATQLTTIETSTTTTIPDLIGGIGSTGGAALPVEATSDNAAGAIVGGVVKIGTEAGTYVSTEADDAVYHVITGSATALDWVYGFVLGGGYVAAGFTWKGFVNSNNDSVTIQAWNGSTWDTRKIIAGKNGTSDTIEDISLLARHTTSGGLVYLRFVSSGGTTPKLNTNLISVQKVNTSRTVGYNEGVSVDTLVGTAGTEAWYNGTGDNPVLTWADAQTIGAAVGISHYHIANSSTITLDRATDNTEVSGDEFTANFGGQSINNSSFLHGLLYTGTFSGYPHLLHSGISAITGPGAKIGWAAIRGPVVSTDGGTSNRWVLHNCWGVDRTDAAFDFGAAVATAQVVYITEYHGVITIKNMNTAGDVLYFTGASDVIIDASCTAGTISFQGQIRLTNNGTGQTIVYDDIATDVDTILTDTTIIKTTANVPREAF